MKLAEPTATLAEQAYSRLEEMIVTLELAPGTLVSEAALSSALGIGRTPTREALQRLAKEHLVTVLPQRGAMISDVHVEGHLLALQVRRALERVVVIGAVRRSLPEERERFSELADQVESAAAEGDDKGFLQLDKEFNALVASCSRNPYASHAITPLHALSRRYWYIHQRRHGELVKTAALHADVMRAIAAGDETSAVRASDALLDYAEAVTREILNDSSHRPPAAA
jgi:DNA-binding GntR family transcriptional regulator